MMPYASRAKPLHRDALDTIAAEALDFAATDGSPRRLLPRRRSLNAI